MLLCVPASYGSPPRMRGKAARPLLLAGGGRITPAHAGKSLERAVSSSLSRDHPRACGEKVVPITVFSPLMGSPPRMRGKAGGHAHAHHERGITPAHAGKSCHAVQAQIVL